MSRVPIVVLTVAVLIAGCGDQSTSPQQPATAPKEPAAPPAQSVAPKDAAKYDGKTITVCGYVSTARYLGESTGRPGSRNPTFLNFGGKFPNHDFSGVIFEENREKFSEPEKACVDKNVCITGKVQMFRDKPEIVITEPNQLKGC